MTVQNNSNNKKEKKGGILGWLSSLFRGGGSTASSLGQAGRGAGYMLGRSAASGFGRFGLGGLASIFGSKAGLLGALLGMATIAAGIAVVYNFMGGSGKSLYGPNLFRNQYYQSMMDKADKDFAARRGAATGQQAGSSSLDYAKAAGEQYNAFSQQAQSADAPKTDEDSSSASSADDNSASSMADALMKSAGKLQPGTGLSGTGKSTVGAGSLGGGGGMSGGIGSGFQGIYRPGSMNAMNAAGQANSVARSAAKRSIGRYNRRGAYAQAKSVKRLLQATKGGDMETAKAGMVNAYETGRTPSDSGAITPGGAGYGTGLGYAPPSATSPSMDGGGGGNSGGSGSGGGGGADPGDSSIPYEEDPDDELNQLLQEAGIAALAALALMLVAGMLSQTQWGKGLAVVVAALACVAAAWVIYDGYLIQNECGDDAQGVMMMAIGAILEFFAIKTLVDCYSKWHAQVQSQASIRAANQNITDRMGLEKTGQTPTGENIYAEPGDTSGVTYTENGQGGLTGSDGNTYTLGNDGGVDSFNASGKSVDNAWSAPNSDMSAQVKSSPQAPKGYTSPYSGGETAGNTTGGGQPPAQGGGGNGGGGGENAGGNGGGGTPPANDLGKDIAQNVATTLGTQVVLNSFNGQGDSDKTA